MKTHEPLSTAKAILSLLVLGIAVVLFVKFQENQVLFFEDLNALRGYVVGAIIGMGFLIVLMYMASQTTHTKVVKVSKTSKVAKRKKK